MVLADYEVPISVEIPKSWIPLGQYEHRGHQFLMVRNPDDACAYLSSLAEGFGGRIVLGNLLAIFHGYPMGEIDTGLNGYVIFHMNVHIDYNKPLKEGWEWNALI